MNMFDYIDGATVMLVNGIPTTNFGYNADDEPEDWSLSIYGYDPEDSMNFEYYLTHDDVDTATQVDDSKWVTAYYEDTTFEFCTLEPVKLED